MTSTSALHASTRAWIVTIVALLLAGISSGQTASGLLPDEPNLAASDGSSLPAAPHPAHHDQVQTTSTCALKHLSQCVKDVAHDQAGIWTSPFRLQPADAAWLLPIAGATGVSIHYDAPALRDLGIDSTRTDVSNAFSSAALYGSLAGDAGLYFLGVTTHNDHLAETGRLGAEAVADTSLVVLGLKLATDRQRPNEGNGQGDFWPNGGASYQWDGSFPSEHSAIMFALAHVISDEYPSTRIKIAAYALALAVSASRVTAREHFPSDVLVGGTIGYLVSGYVVDHRASTRTNSGLFITPVVDEATQTYGLQIQVLPESGVRTVRKLFSQLERAR